MKSLIRGWLMMVLIRLAVAGVIVGGVLWSFGCGYLDSDVEEVEEADATRDEVVVTLEDLASRLDELGGHLSALSVSGDGEKNDVLEAVDWLSGDVRQLREEVRDSGSLTHEEWSAVRVHVSDEVYGLSGRLDALVKAIEHDRGLDVDARAALLTAIAELVVPIAAVSEALRADVTASAEVIRAELSRSESVVVDAVRADGRLTRDEVAGGGAGVQAELAALRLELEAVRAETVGAIGDIDGGLGDDGLVGRLAEMEARLGVVIRASGSEGYDDAALLSALEVLRLDVTAAQGVAVSEYALQGDRLDTAADLRHREAMRRLDTLSGDIGLLVTAVEAADERGAEYADFMAAQQAIQSGNATREQMRLYFEEVAAVLFEREAVEDVGDGDEVEELGDVGPWAQWEDEWAVCLSRGGLSTALVDSWVIGGLTAEEREVQYMASPRLVDCRIYEGEPLIASAAGSLRDRGIDATWTVALDAGIAPDGYDRYVHPDMTAWLDVGDEGTRLRASAAYGQVARHIYERLWLRGRPETHFRSAGFGVQPAAYYSMIPGAVLVEVVDRQWFRDSDVGARWCIEHGVDGAGGIVAGERYTYRQWDDLVYNCALLLRAEPVEALVWIAERDPRIEVDCVRSWWQRVRARDGADNIDEARRVLQLCVRE